MLCRCLILYTVHCGETIQLLYQSLRSLLLSGAYINLRFVSSKMVDVLCMHIEHNEHNCMGFIIVVSRACVTFAFTQSISMIFILEKRTSDRTRLLVYICLSQYGVCVCAAGAH